jgi:hypothetical protein
VLDLEDGSDEGDPVIYGVARRRQEGSGGKSRRASDGSWSAVRRTVCRLQQRGRRQRLDGSVGFGAAGPRERSTSVKVKMGSRWAATRDMDFGCAPQG